LGQQAAFDLGRPEPAEKPYRGSGPPCVFALARRKAGEGKGEGSR
jgi:hypothetical protein